MKTSSSDLFDLIKALSMQERRRIRKEMVLNNKEKKTLLLYDVICKQKKFDELAIQKKIGNPIWYSQLKKYLHQITTDKIFAGKYDEKKQTHVLKLIIIANLFLDKGLVKQAQKKLEQALVTCKRNEWIEYIPIINSKLSNIIGLKNEQRKNHSFYIEAYSALNQSYLEKKYSLLFRSVEFSNNSEQANQFKDEYKIIEYSADEKHLSSLRQKLHYYQFLASYYKSVELDFAKSYFYCNRYLEVVIEKNKEEENQNLNSEVQKSDRRRNNLVGISNLIIAALNANFFSEAEKLFHLFLKLEHNNIAPVNSTLYSYFSESKLELVFVISTTNFTRRGIYNKQFNFYLDQFHLVENDMNHRHAITCYEQIALYHFMNSAASKSVTAINRILNDNELYKIYPEIYANMLLLQLFVNYENNDLDSLPYNFKRAIRYFEKHYSPIGYEKVILDFFNELIHVDYEEHIKTIKKYSEEMKRMLLKDRKFSLTYLTERTFIDFESWLESKITSKTLLEVLIEKSKLRYNKGVE